MFEAEYRAIVAACEELEEGYCPRVTFIIVTKRHNVRLLPTADTPLDTSGNVSPGVVVDTEICHPIDFDFYLNSHASLQVCLSVCVCLSDRLLPQLTRLSAGLSV